MDFLSLISKISCYFHFKCKKVFTTKVVGRVYFFGRGHLILGDNVKLDGSFRSNPIFGYTRCVVIIKNNATLQIDEYSGLSGCTIVVKSNVKIGKHVLIGAGVKIYDNDFHQLSFDTRIKEGDLNITTKPVVIKNGAFIGAGCIILKGSIIGEGAVVGAGSVVSTEIPDYEVWAGNPARFIRKIKRCQK